MASTVKSIEDFQDVEDPFREPTDTRCMQTLTEDGDALRFVEKYRGVIRYAAGRWHYYDGICWIKDERNKVPGLVTELIREAGKKTFDIKDDIKKQNRFVKYWVDSLRLSHIRAVLGLASYNQEVTMKFEDFDADPFLLNCLNGTFDLRGKYFRGHDPKDLITKAMNVEYDEKADCPMWEDFIETITRDAVGDDRPDVAKYLQTLLGYALYGEFEEKVFPVCFGPPDTSKSTFFEVLTFVFGSYHAAADVTAFDMGRYANSGHTDSIAALRGARLITATEPKEFFNLNSSLIKRVTGNDTFQASHKHEQTFNMKIVGLMMLATNHRMMISATDDAVWIRVKEIPFENVIPKTMQIKGYAEELKQEGPGILNWLIDGWHLYRAIKGKIEPPKVVAQNTKEYQRSQDKVESFLEECCKLDDPEAKTRSSELHRIYSIWLKRNGFRTESNRAFTFTMERKGQFRTRDSKAVWWQGIEPNDDWMAV